MQVAPNPSSFENWGTRQMNYMEKKPVIGPFASAGKVVLSLIKVITGLALTILGGSAYFGSGKNFDQLKSSYEFGIKLLTEGLKDLKKSGANLFTLGFFRNKIFL